MREVLVKNEEFKDSPLGRIPKDWQVDKLVSRASVFGGKRLPLGHSYSDNPTKFRYLRVVDFFERDIDFEALEFLKPSTFKAIERYEIHKGNLFISIAGSLGYVGVFGTKYQEQRTILTENAARIVLHDDSLPEFVAYQMNNSVVQKQIEAEKGTGGGVPKLALFRIENLLLTFPPREEQEKIVAILQTLDEAIACTSSLIIKLKQTKAGLLQDLLTRGLDENGKLRDPQAHPEQFKDLALGRIPQKWTVKEFGEYIAHLDSGWSPICEAEPVANGEWGVLKTTAVVWSGYNPSESKKLPSNLEPRYSSVVETDDILITRKGPRERVGVVVHIPSTPANLMMPDTVFRVRLKESSPLLPAFIPLTLGSVSVQQDWNRKKVGLAEAQVDINYGIVRETIIYIPPKSEQKYIIQILNTYDTRIRTEETYLNKLKLQKQGLMQDLLTGKVRVNTIK
ncbi:restriction endonuclease subunit S [Nostoc sp.]|uniref:restriction endonuclease subunit S n=1 Tax=Nostoc sp. TaxID=1180 RepID=UPI002FF46095